MNQCADELKLTGFITNHSGMCQNRDCTEGNTTQMET